MSAEQRAHTYSSSDSESTIDVVDTTTMPIMEDGQQQPVSSSSEIKMEADFWMATRQTQCGATISERMASFMKGLTAAQSEFAEKLAVLSANELARAKSSADDAAMYQDYWIQLQLAMRLCRTLSQSTKEMTTAVSQLLTPMDRIVHIGRARLKESAIWNVELNKALSVFHTNVAKRQAKCYKALSVVMTPEYFDQSPARKNHAVRRAAPTVAKYVEQIDEANAWLSKYMSQRPALKNRLQTLESKRVEITRTALTTFATQLKSMGIVMTESAVAIINGVAKIDDDASRSTFIMACREMPTPHLERPALFEYTLPVPISELGIRPVRDQRLSRPSAHPHRDEDNFVDPAPSFVSSPRSSAAGDDTHALGKRISSFANMMFGGQAPPQQQQQQQRANPDRADDNNDEEEQQEPVVNTGEDHVARFGNIIVHNEFNGGVGKVPMKTVRRTAAVANISDMDASFTTGAAAPTA